MNTSRSNSYGFQVQDLGAGGDAFSNDLVLKSSSEKNQELEYYVRKCDSKYEAFQPAAELCPANAFPLCSQLSTLGLTTVSESFLREVSSSENEGEGDVPCKEEKIPDTLQKSLPTQDAKVMKYKFDDNYLACVQNFTSYCEDKKELSFDGSVFFDDEFFPRSMQLTEYVPINVVAPFVERIEMQVPSSSEYCKFAPCGSTLYDYFEDYYAFNNRESILRSQVIFVLSSLQCPKLISLDIDSTPSEDASTDRYPVDRLATWKDNISSFISRHTKSLKYLQLRLVRYKSLGSTGCSSNYEARSKFKESFPKLIELGVTLWDNQAPTSTDPGADTQSEAENDRNVWIPEWFPDAADQYCVSLMKSQVYGILTKLCWISAAKLCWNEVFQPILDANMTSLESLHILEIKGLLSTTKTKESSNLTNSSFSSSNIVLSCAAFSKLCNLKCLSLRKTNCFLTDLSKLPKSLEELSIDDINIKSTEIKTLAALPNLKILRLADITPVTSTEFGDSLKQFGVNKDVLKDLLHTRHLEELCIWRHCLDLDMNTLSNPEPSNLNSILEKINSYLTTICQSSHKISPSEFCEWDSGQQSQDRKLLESLEKLGFVDEECIVIHKSNENKK